MSPLTALASSRSAFSAGRHKSPSGPLIVIGAIATATFLARRLGYKLGGHTVVRCRQGHLFTTIWIPGVKLKALDLGIARLQRCPVGEHWSLVTPVRESDLTDEEREFAHAHHDVRIP